jgi:hypothetical protein
MLGTVFFLIAPVLGRILPILPPLAITGPETMGNFAIGVHLSHALAVAILVALYARKPKHGRPMLVTAAAIVAQSVLFETVGRSATWESVFTAIVDVPVAVVASLGVALGAAALWTGWIRVPPRVKAAAAA